MYASYLTNLKPETQKNFDLFVTHNQSIKKKAKKELVKDLESNKRVLLLHPQSQQRSFV